MWGGTQWGQRGYQVPGATHMAAENWTAASASSSPTCLWLYWCKFYSNMSIYICSVAGDVAQGQCLAVSTKAQHSINWHDSTRLRGQHCRDAGRHATQHCPWLQKHSSLAVCRKVCNSTLSLATEALFPCGLDTPAGKLQQCPLHTHRSYCPYGLTPMSVPLHTWFTISPDLYLSLCNAKAQTQASHMLHMLNKHSPTAASFHSQRWLWTSGPPVSTSRMLRTQHTLPCSVYKMQGWNQGFCHCSLRLETLLPSAAELSHCCVHRGWSINACLDY